MKNWTNALEHLYTHVGMRRTPQAVAATLLETGLVESLPTKAADSVRTLVPFDPAVLTQRMPEDFHAPAAPAKAAQAARSAMYALTHGTEDAAVWEREVPTDVEDMGAWVDAALSLLGFADRHPQEPVRKRTRLDSWTATTSGARGDKRGHVDIRNRMNRNELTVAFPGVSSKKYLKAVRAVAHLQQRHSVFAKETAIYNATMFGKTRLGYTITRDEFVDDPATAIFVSYYLARLGMRTVFTSGPQDRPMDDLGEMLLEHALASPTCRADVIAKVLTRKKVLARLTDEQKGELVGQYYQTLESIGGLLESVWRDGRDRRRMVVQKGDDSTTWNVASRAWNQARTGWLNLMSDLGLTHVIEGICPGKVPALIAGDVMQWHIADTGSSAQGDVEVWATLPEPWEVVNGEVPCTAEMVRDACKAAGLDPDKTGWTQPYRQDALAVTKPAPALLHGVVVHSATLAAQLGSRTP